VYEAGFGYNFPFSALAIHRAQSQVEFGPAHGNVPFRGAEFTRPAVEQVSRKQRTRLTGFHIFRFFEAILKQPPGFRSVFSHH